MGWGAGSPFWCHTEVFETQRVINSVSSCRLFSGGGGDSSPNWRGCTASPQTVVELKVCFRQGRSAFDSKLFVAGLDEKKSITTMVKG